MVVAADWQQSARSSHYLQMGYVSKSRNLLPTVWDFTGNSSKGLTTEAQVFWGCRQRALFRCNSDLACVR